MNQDLPQQDIQQQGNNIADIQNREYTNQQQDSYQPNTVPQLNNSQNLQDYNNNPQLDYNNQVPVQNQDVQNQQYSRQQPPNQYINPNINQNQNNYQNPPEQQQQFVNNTLPTNVQQQKVYMSNQNPQVQQSSQVQQQRYDQNYNNQFQQNTQIYKNQSIKPNQNLNTSDSQHQNSQNQNNQLNQSQNSSQNYKQAPNINQQQEQFQNLNQNQNQQQQQQQQQTQQLQVNAQPQDTIKVDLNVKNVQQQRKPTIDELQVETDEILRKNPVKTHLTNKEVNDIILDNTEILLEIAKQQQGRQNKNFVHSNLINLVASYEKNLIKLCRNMKGLGEVVTDEQKPGNKITFQKFFKRQKLPPKKK